MSKIFVITHPISGTVYGTLGYVKELAARGHEVAYFSTDEFEKDIINVNAQFIKYNKKYDFENNYKLMIKTTLDMYKEALDIAKDFDYIIYDSGFFKGKELGEKLKKPVIRLISNFPFDKKVLKNLSKEEKKKYPRMLLSKNPLIRKIYTILAIGFNKIQNNDISYEAFDEVPDMNIVYTTKIFQDLNYGYDKRKYKFVLPVIVNRNQENIIKFENAKGKIIYISLGVCPENPEEFFKKCIEAFINTNVTVIMSIGQNTDILDLGKVPSNFWIFNSVAQLEVLKHADLFITHGGMTSINEAMYCGVPVIVAPQNVENELVAKSVLKYNIGKVIYKENFNVDILRNYANEVITLSEYRSNMETYKDTIMNNNEKDNVIDEIENYINSYSLA